MKFIIIERKDTCCSVPDARQLGDNFVFTYFSMIHLCLSYEVLLALDKEKHKFWGPIYYYVFNTLLFALLVLHIYWWVLIYRMLVKQIQARGRVGEDVRSGKYFGL